MPKKKSVNTLDFLDKWIGYCKTSGKVSLDKISAADDGEFVASVKKNARDIRNKLYDAMPAEDIVNKNVKISTSYTFDNKAFPGSLKVVGSKIVVDNVPAFKECSRSARTVEAYVTADDKAVLEFTLEGSH